MALGGGGARGFAELGVLEVLERARIKLDIISGTSMGAVIGALYCLEPDIEKVKATVFSFLNRPAVKELEERFAPPSQTSKLQARFKKPFLFIKELYTWNIKALRKWLVDYRPFEEIFKEVFGEKKFSDCKIPFICVATDLLKGKEFYIEEGLLYEALLASTALPGVFPPLRYKEKFLVDGGVLEALPTEALEKRVEFILGVSLERKPRMRKIDSSLNILLSIDEIRYNKLVELAKQKADFLLEPETQDLGWAEFSRIEELIEKGRIEAEQKLEDLKKKIRFKRFINFFKLAEFKNRRWVV